MEYTKHRFNIYPEMQPEEFERLRTNIFINGYDPKQPIWIFEGGIIDGWNRYRACQALGITPVFKQFEGSELDAMQFVVRTNDRRDLTSSQRAAIAIEAEDLVKILKEEAAKRYAETVGRPRKESPQLIAEIIPREQREARTQLAETFGTNRQYIQDAAKIKAENPEAFAAIKEGKKTITEVKKEEKIKQRREYIEQQVKEIEAGDLPELHGLFDIVSVDPPWPYGREYDPEGSRAANPYPEMSIKQIKAIQLPLTSDSIIFLWTTHAFLRDAFDILEMWGATYKATMVWNKQKIGMGAWFRMQCEFCLVGIIGKPFWNNTQYPEIIEEPRREHSRKPDAFFKLVNNICVGRKLEYFSRERREGWENYGNEPEKF